ncbi:MAG TPA: 50S ribosomal protein L11 methyltransferase [Chthoniobacterales bacterium]|jgi:ribosomal protein L11 methyltransferase|nr:50S ribosomal protein L11 methyltransferase [Chthoniobacterales bacterium]
MYIWRKQATAEWLQSNAEALQRLGPGLAIIERPGKSRALVQVYCRTQRETSALQRRLGGTCERLPADWQARFARASLARPLRVGGRLIVVSDAGKTAGSTETIVIPAEAAFGTGEHATTAMCLRMLERATRKSAPGWRMLDAGTGSGILAIAARRFGARDIIAIDNDPTASATARRNAGRNGARGIEFRTGDVLRAKLLGRFDLITANLFSDLLITTLPCWRRLLSENGCLILSGILRAQEPALVAALGRNRFVAQEIRRRGKWVAILAAPRRKNS